MANLFANNALGTLSASIGTTTTNLVLATGASLFPTPTGGNTAQLALYDTLGNIEFVKLTARSGSTLTVVRAQEGTTALSWPAGTTIELRLTAVSLTEFRADIDSKLPSASYTAADVLAKIKTVDGASSGLDADVLRGYAPDVNAGNDTIALRSGNGNLYATGFNTALADTPSRPSSIFVEKDDDGFIRPQTLATFQKHLLSGVSQNNAIRHLLPDGGQSYLGVSTGGYVKIELPTLTGNAGMITAYVDIYNYGNATPVSLVITGYAYTATEWAINGAYAYQIGGLQSWMVRWCNDGSRLSLVIGDNDVGNYTRVVVREVIQSTYITQDLSSGWVISKITALTGLTAQKTTTTYSNTPGDILTQLKTVDGAGTGLDADLLDGVQGADYARTDTAETFTSDVTINGDLNLPAKQLIGGIGAETTAGVLDWNDISNARSGNGLTLLLGTASNGPGPAQYFHSFSFEYMSKNGTGNMTQFAIPYGSSVFGPYWRLRFSGNWTPWITIWTSENDGPGSGLDADTIDGIEGADIVQTSRSIAAGTGLTGGGTLAANRTISADIATQAEAEAGTSSTKLMTPQRVAQAIDAQAPVGLHTGTSSTETNYPVGHTLVAASSATVNRNASSTIYYNSSSAWLFQNFASGGVALAGTWRARGHAAGVAGESSYAITYQRVA